MLKCIAIALYFLCGLGLPQCLAADHYVRSAATGAATGANWTDAYTALPAALTRGDTYYIAGGSYAAYTFNDAVDGQLITIKKATQSNHGTNTGWDSSYASQAMFTGVLYTTTGDLHIDGAVRDEANWLDSTAYGFALLNGQAGTKAIDVGNLDTPSGVTVSYCYIPGFGASVIGNRLIYNYYWQGGCKVDHCLVQQAGQNGMKTGPGINNLIIEKNYFDTNYSSAEAHGEMIQTAGGSDVIIRHNIFKDTVGTGTIVLNSVTTWQIYGNVFINGGGSNGLIAVTSSETANGVSIFQNTFINTPAAHFDSLGLGTNWDIRNNIIYGSTLAPGFGAHTHDYNASDRNLGEANDEIIDASYFIGNNPLNLTLRKSTSPGDSTIGATFATDRFGLTRGSPYSWDRGASIYDSVLWNVTSKKATTGSKPMRGL